MKVNKILIFLTIILSIGFVITVILADTKVKVNTIDYKIKYDSLLDYDSDMSNHIRRDFGIDTITKTQYKQINVKQVNLRK